MKASRIEETKLVVKEAYVDVSKSLKRIQPAPQGRAHRIKKRSNHVTIIIGTPAEKVDQVQEQVQEQVIENKA